MFDKGNWQAFTAVIKYIEDLTVWAATTKEKGEDVKKYNLLWLLPRNREGPDGRGEMDMNSFPLLDTEAHRKQLKRRAKTQEIQPALAPSTQSRRTRRTRRDGHEQLFSS